MHYMKSLLFVVMAVTTPISFSVSAQQTLQQNDSLDNSQYILFIHTGGAPVSPPDLIKSVLAALVNAGYSVRNPDDQRDTVGGPGVDYFVDADAKKAQEVADTVNLALKNRLGDSSLQPLKARPQRVKNPRGYLGVWLF
jgi:hypothetical protein